MGKPKSDEIEEMARQVANDVMQEDDELDKLINKIISVEKQHRLVSAGGRDRKHKQISKLIDEYIKSGKHEESSK